MTRKILSLDLSIHQTGFCFCLSNERITNYELGNQSFKLGTPTQIKKMKLTPEETQGRQLVLFARWFREMIIKYFPDEVCIERSFLNTNPSTEILLMIRGVVLMNCSHREIPVYSYATSSLKAFALEAGYVRRYKHLKPTPRRKAVKDEMVKAAQIFLNDPAPITDDAADAIHCCRLHLSKTS